MNLSIPDATAELAVSETRLRRTLLENAVPTLVEFRQTRTGVRKTTVLTPEAISQLRALFATGNAPVATIAAIAATERGSASFEAPEPEEAPMPSVCPFDEEEASPAMGLPEAPAAQTIPLAQFNALLYQHNVLREELARVTEYLDGCDRLLGEMVRTISTLEERTRELEPARSPRRAAVNPLSGAFRKVSSNVHNALFARSTAKSMLKRPEVYYGSVLAGRS